MALGCDDVKAMASSGRVRPGPAYHARAHAVKWEAIVAALTGCYSVTPDRRTDPAGRPLHPDGYIMLCWHRSTGRKYRVDADCLKDSAGDDILFIATGFPI